MPRLARSLALLCALSLPAAAQQEQPELEPDHPQRYTVQKGDTLWDIADRFLENPWMWPEIWHVNPQIENPHRIYPGDVLSLTYIDGEPRVTLDRGEGERPTVKLSPKVRVEEIPEAISTIPREDIEPYLHRLRVMQPGRFERLPYVVANEEQTLLAVPGDKVYVRQLAGDAGTRFAVMRHTHTYRYARTAPETRERRAHSMGRGHDHQSFWAHIAFWGDDGEVLGYELQRVGSAELQRGGDPATARVISAQRPLRAGDRLVPLEESPFPAQFMPHPPEQVPPGAQVIAASESSFGASHYQVVAINIGEAGGVEPGHTLAAYGRGERVADEVKHPRGFWDAPLSDDTHVTLPEEYHGHMLVFRTFDKISYALVLEGQRPVRIHDLLRMP